MHKKWRFIVAFIGVLVFGMMMPAEALAHGVSIEYSSDIEITVVALYDNGSPLSGAQVTVYAPDDPANAWLTGTCDEDGRFSFKPDPSIPGTWDIQVRLAGHGGMVHIPVGEGAATTGGAGGYSFLQIAVMAVCVIWGCIGTALYFRRRRA